MKIEDKINMFLNEEDLSNVDNFIKTLDKTIKKHFPKSLVEVYFSKGLGKSISVRFTIGKDKSEYSNSIIQNDPMFQTFMVAYEQFTPEGMLKDKITAESGNAGLLAVKPPEGSYLAQGRVKLGWRKKTGTPAQIIKHFDNYFKKSKKIFLDNKENLLSYHQDVIGNKY